MGHPAMPGRRRQLWIASVLFVALSSAGEAQFIDPRQVAPQTGAPPASGTGIIIGQVIDGTTGAPVPEAIVRISGPGAGLWRAKRGASEPEAPSVLALELQRPRLLRHPKRTPRIVGKPSPATAALVLTGDRLPESVRR